MMRRFLALILITGPVLAGCSLGSIVQPPTPTPTSEDVPVISQAELEEIIAGVSQKYGVPAVAAAVVTDQGLQAAAAVGVRKWGDPTPVTLDDSWPLGSDTNGGNDLLLPGGYRLHPALSKLGLDCRTEITFAGDISGMEVTMSTQDTEYKTGSPGIVIEPEAIARLDARLAQMTRDGAFTGSVLVAHERNIHLSQGYGFADRAQKIPNTPQTRFHLGSMTKQFTAMGILILQSRGKLCVQDPICNYITDCPKEWQEITIHHLLTHTSGLSSQLSNELYREIEAGTSGPVTPTEQAHYLGLTRQWSLDTQPGEQYAYNNFGYILLAHIIEGVSGQSYADLLEQTIFAPLNMRNTGYQDNSSGVAKCYLDRDDTTGVQFGSPPISEGSGHLYSTSEDLFLWDQALYTDRLLPRDERELLFKSFVRDIGDRTPGTPAALGFGYGYGWFVGRDRGLPIVAGAGGGPSFATLIMRYPEDELVAIILTNQGGIDWSVWATISNALFGEE